MRIWPFKRKRAERQPILPYPEWTDADCAAYMMMAANLMANRHTLMNCIITIIADRDDITLSETRTMSVRVSMVADSKKG